jgi:hypothetical protein
MKKFYILLFSVLTCSVAFGQKGKNQIIPAIEVGLPVGEFDGYKTGFGFLGKLLIGFGKNSQLGLTTGYTAFKSKLTTDDFKIKTSVVPFLLTYRYNLSALYLEPQVGYGSYTTTTKEEVGGTETKTTDGGGAFTWSVGAGVQVGSVDLGLRFQAGSKDEMSVGYFGIHAGYIFQAGKK